MLAPFRKPLAPVFLIAAAALAFPTFARAQEIAPAVLAREIAARADRVPEFVEIAKMAGQRRLRVWLFGGTAAAYAHYVKWDLLRAAGDSRFGSAGASPNVLFQPDRFNYDFMNIYRSTQDLDLVVDGSAEQVTEFQSALKNLFPYFMGSKGEKDQWELRPLREGMGDKEPLLANPDFFNQHTDSNSTGMVELTRGAGDPIVRDLRDWKSREPQFLRDVAEGKLHYYFSDRHETTPRFKVGKNDPILSVVRFFTKAFQYELEVRTEDILHLRRIIDAFDPNGPRANPVTTRWLERNGPKLFQHAVDVDHAWNTLEQLGLRQKLASVGLPAGATNEIATATVGSLRWWMNKEPLRPRGSASHLAGGRTARELGIEIVAHETSGFLTYEAIRRSHKGTPNVFVSRALRNGRPVPGETAALGDGFYTRIGRNGARGTGFHIRMRVSPDAVEGVDFLKVGADYVLWLTRDKLEIIQESLRLTPLAALQFLFDPANKDETGIKETFKRKLAQFSVLESSAAEVTAYIDGLMQAPENHGAVAVEYLTSPSAFINPHWTRWFEQVMETVSTSKEYDWVGNDPVGKVLGQPHVIAHPKWLEWAGRLRSTRKEAFAYHILLQSAAIRHPTYGPLWYQWVEQSLADKEAALPLIHWVLGQPEIKTLPLWQGWIETLIHQNDQDIDAALLGSVLIHKKAPDTIAPTWKKWLDLLLGRARSAAAVTSMAYALQDPSQMTKAEWPQWMEILLDRAHIHGDLRLQEAISYLLARPEVIALKNWPTWVKTALKNPLWGPKMMYRILCYGSVLENLHWFDLVESILDDERYQQHLSGILVRPIKLEKLDRWIKLIDKAVKISSMGPFLAAASLMSLRPPRSERDEGKQKEWYRVAMDHRDNPHVRSMLGHLQENYPSDCKRWLGE